MVECVPCMLIFLVRLLGRHEMDAHFLVASYVIRGLRGVCYLRDGIMRLGTVVGGGDDYTVTRRPSFDLCAFPGGPKRRAVLERDVLP